MKAFNAFSCSGNSLVTSKTRQVFSMLASTFSAILDLYLLTQSHSSHSSLLRKCNIRSDWMKFTKRDDVMNTAFNEVYQTGKGVSAWQKPRTTWTVWESGYYFLSLAQRQTGFAKNIWGIIKTVASFWLWKYAQILVLGHYLFLKAHSSLPGTENVHWQISKHICAQNVGYCLYST